MQFTSLSCVCVGRALEVGIIFHLAERPKSCFCVRAFCQFCVAFDGPTLYLVLRFEFQK